MLAELTNQTLPTNVKTPYGLFTVQTTKDYLPGKEITIDANVTGNLLRTEKFMEDKIGRAHV